MPWKYGNLLHPWKKVFLGFLLISTPELHLHARQYAVRKPTLLRKISLADDHSIQAYVEEFLEKNPEAQEYLPFAREETLMAWAKALAKKIEERYSLFAPSTVIHRRQYHEGKILSILKQHYKRSHQRTLGEPLDTTSPHPTNIHIPSLKHLLHKNKEEEQNRMENLEKIAIRLKTLPLLGGTKGEEEEKAIEGDLLTIIEHLRGHYHSILETFGGLRHLSVQKKLDKKWHVLSQREHFIENYLQELLQHAHSLQDLNQSMNAKLHYIFSDAHLGITPYGDKAMALQWEMLLKALRELESLRVNLPEEKKNILDYLCKVLAINLWKEWFGSLQTSLAQTNPSPQDLRDLRNSQAPQTAPAAPASTVSPKDSPSLTPTLNPALNPLVPTTSSIPAPVSKDPSSISAAATSISALPPDPIPLDKSLPSAALAPSAPPVVVPSQREKLETLQGELLSLLSHPLDKAGVMERLLSPSPSYLLLSKVQLQGLCERILKLLTLVQGEFKPEELYQSLRAEMPLLWKNALASTQSWGKKAITPPPTSPSLPLQKPEIPPRAVEPSHKIELVNPLSKELKGADGEKDGFTTDPNSLSRDPRAPNTHITPPMADSRAPVTAPKPPVTAPNSPQNGLRGSELSPH